MSADSRRSRLLIVDDDFATRLLAEEALLPAGMEIVSAGDGEEALAEFDARTPDAILLDINLPGIDGYEVCRRIRQRPRGAITPVLVMTNSDDVDAVEEAFRAGATDFLTKPLNLVLLAHRLRYMLRASRAFHEVRDGAQQLAHGQRLARLASWQIVDGRFEWSRRALEALWPGAPETGPFDDLVALAHPDDRERLAAAMASGARHQIDFRLQLPDGSERVVHQEAELVGDEGGGVLIGATQDVTEMRRAEEQITQLAFFDDLTGLANRAFVHRYLRRAVSEARKGRHQLAVLAIDLDLFRQVNDTFGSHIGDTLLREAAARIERCIHGDAPAGAAGEPSDPDGFSGIALAARLTADEFIVVLGRVAHPEEVAATAARIHAALAERFVLGASEVLLTASIGIAVFPDSGEDSQSLLERADAALSHAKAGGRNAVRLFSESLQHQLQDRADIERRLRRAIASLPPRGQAGETALAEFEIYYQPKVSTETGMLTGVEALLRWHPLDRMPIAPDVFIPIAEETGLIVPLGMWVLREACRRAERWRREGTVLRVAVNVSARQFREAFFPQQVAEVLAETGLDARLLELELSERLLMSDSEHAARAMRELKQLGVSIALDDFGIGYSSLSYLTRLPLDTLKVDRSFVRGLAGEPSSEPIITAIVALARSLGLRIVAEGIETLAELALLTRHGATEVQGYYFARPMPADDLVREMLDQGRLPPAIALEVDEVQVA